MRATVKSLLMYLLIVALLTGNLYLISDVNLSAQIVYAIIILVVLYSGESIFWGRRFAPGFIYGIALIGTVFFFEMLSGWIKVEGFDFRFELVLSSFIFQLFVATGEEISFRGYILKNLIAETGIMRGIVVSSFMFSAIHLPSFVYYGLDFSRGGVNFIVVGMLGAIASIIYLNHGLFSAVAFHFSWNFLQYNVFNLSEVQEGMMEISYMEKGLLSGGGFGPEAGVLGFAVVLAALILLIKKYAKSLS